MHIVQTMRHNNRHHKTSALDSVGIVGAGPGGLATGILLASHGVPTTIYESESAVGGRCKTLKNQGFMFDRGPTFFLMPEVLDELLALTGETAQSVGNLTELNPMYRLDIGWSGRVERIDAVRDLARMQARLNQICPGDGDSFLEFCRLNEKKLSAFEPVLRNSFDSPFDAIRSDFVKGGLRLDPFRSLKTVNSSYFSHPVSQIAVGFQSKYLGMSAAECPSLFSILPLIEYGFGVWHPKGGCGQLMQSLADLFVRLGGTIRLDSPVAGLLVEGKSCDGVVLQGGSEHRHDHVVMNADAAWAINNLMPSHIRGAWGRRRTAKAKYSCSTAMLYLGVDGEVDLPHHTIRVAEDYEQNLRDISRGNGRTGVVSEDPSFYVCNPSVTDDSMAPDGCSSLYILIPTPNQKSGLDWSAELPALRQKVLSTLTNEYGIDLSERIRVECVETPQTWAQSNIEFGATFSLSHTLDQMAFRRPSHRWPGVDGLWMVGGGTHPGSGLPVIFLGAKSTAESILKSAGIANQLPPSTPVAQLATFSTGAHSTKEVIHV
jgi:phytoene desaturase